ncbi:uncharacterized protein Z519_04143 [Cladophialophora bantiana CBS 173.52]|uniref:Uncharacterized protein n=1 Tax=Cladophialophora bantiana (strain ATCC 10958 / CBS 173.52 / CDC B-1940 / NIH 8579) TaxID=1442370 RepID=A0A0D2HQ59_CLAB1|nr:uncharacterized protein Z519_04143 [Cladophialophora bantiana CBS 173.52]KIW95558.1 hypothetical protein Z519_04143 [Cladophialophora bantiana CBS 173.52]
MAMLNGIKEFLRAQLYGPSPSRAKSEESGNTGVDDLPAATDLWGKVQRELKDPGRYRSMETDDRRFDDKFRRMYKRFREELRTCSGTWHEAPWLVFDRFKWSEVHRAKIQLGLLSEAEGADPIPRLRKVLMATGLYIVLLATRQSLDRMMKDIQKTLEEDFPLLARTQMRFWTPEMRQLKSEEVMTVRGWETFNRMLENMSLELSVALGQIKKGNVDDQAGTEEGNRKPICEVLRREIHKEHPHLDLPDLSLHVEL